MPYYTSKTLSSSFDDSLLRLKEALKTEGFGVLTEIDMRETLKNKLGVDIPRYRILGACNPPFAYKALQAEERIGLLLPCNIVLRETEGGLVEVAAIRPTESMRLVGSEALLPIAREVEERLARVLLAL